MVMKYAVVSFDDNSYSEVPISWLCDNNQNCWWPNSKNVSHFIIKATEPDINKWKKHQVFIQEFCDSLEKARKRAIDMSGTETDYSDHEETSKRKVTRRHPVTYISEASSDGSDFAVEKKRTLEAAPEFPTFDDDSIFLPIQLDNDAKINDTVGFPEMENAEILAISPLLSESAALKPTQLSETDGNIPEQNMTRFMQKILESLAEIKIEIRDLKSAISTAGKINLNKHDTVTKYLPVTDKEKFDDLNDLFLDETTKHEFIQYITSIGGNSAKDSLHRILKLVFCNSFAVKCSWLGLRNNIKLEGTTIMNILRDFSVNMLGVQRKGFEDITSEWFRHSQQRLKRQQKI